MNWPWSGRMPSLFFFDPIDDAIPFHAHPGKGATSFSQNGRWFFAACDIGIHVWDFALIRARLRELNLDRDGPPDLPPPIGINR